jgi:hypothetical protein
VKLPFPEFLITNGVLMPIVSALAGIMVNNLDAAVAWYEKLLDRPADKRPMDGLAEWQMPDGGWIQVYEDKERAGFSSVTFAVKGSRTNLNTWRPRRFRWKQRRDPTT